MKKIIRIFIIMLLLPVRVAVDILALTAANIIATAGAIVHILKGRA